MKFKKILSAFAAITMSLSAFNFSYAESTDNVIINETFQSYNDGYVGQGGAKVELDRTKTHTADNTGALKVSATSATPKVYHYIYNFDKKQQKLQEGEAYLFKAYIYGERISKSTANVKLSFLYDGVYFYASDSVSVKTGEWTEVTQYFIAGVSDAQNVFQRRINIEFTDATAGTVAEDNCDIFYVDDMTVEKLSNADQYFTKTTNNFGKFDKSIALKYAFAGLDVAKTKNVLTTGETTDLKAYLQDGAAGTTASALTRKVADTQYITATSSDESVASYAEGKITAKASGNAVLTYTYSDGETTATMQQLITVSSNTANIIDTKYATVTDPIDAEDTAKTAIFDKTIDLGISGNTPAVVSYRIYFNGIAVNNNYSRCLGKTGIYFSGSTSKKESVNVHGQTYDGCDRIAMFQIGDNYYPSTGVRNLPINSGWNNLDFVIDYPTVNSYADGYMKVSLYVNGEMKNSQELKFSDSSKNLLFTGDKNGSSIINDLTVVSMKEDLKVKSTNPATGEKLSTLDDIDVEFNQAPNITDVSAAAKLYMGDTQIATENTFYAAKNTLSVRPIGGLKANTKYTLKLDKTVIKTNTNEELVGDTELVFTTDSTKISDVAGAGYTLLNSQYDMIRNGNYAFEGNGKIITEDGSATLCLPNLVGGKNTISVAAEDTFLATNDADRVVVEFDTKVVSSGGNDETAIWLVSAKNNTKEGTITQLGKTRDGKSASFNVMWNELSTGEDGTVTAVYPKGNGELLDGGKLYLANKGYAHVKIIYDLKQQNESGDVAQTVILTVDGKEYTCGPKYSTFIREACTGITNITGVSVSMNMYDINRTVYLKNVNMYALKYDPDSMPSAEITMGELSDEELNTITNAAQLNGKKVSFEAALTNYKLESNQNYTIIVAAFDKDTNKLIDMSHENGTVAVGKTAKFEGELDLTAYTTGTAVIKVFAWNSFSGAVPLTEAFTYQF